MTISLKNEGRLVNYADKHHLDADNIVYYSTIHEMRNRKGVNMLDAMKALLKDVHYFILPKNKGIVEFLPQGAANPSDSKECEDIPAIEDSDVDETNTLVPQNCLAEMELYALRHNLFFGMIHIDDSVLRLISAKIYDSVEDLQEELDIDMLQTVKTILYDRNYMVLGNGNIVEFSIFGKTSFKRNIMEVLDAEDFSGDTTMIFLNDEVVVL